MQAVSALKYFFLFVFCFADVFLPFFLHPYNHSSLLINLQRILVPVYLVPVFSAMPKATSKTAPISGRERRTSEKAKALCVLLAYVSLDGVLIHYAYI